MATCKFTDVKVVLSHVVEVFFPFDSSCSKNHSPFSSFRYPNLEAFSLDVRLVFDNCETFNEDDSDIGRAGHNMRKYFEKKWTEIFKAS